VAKDDILDLPARPPRKARQLERAPDVWLARWLAEATLTPSDLRRVEAEKARRKANAPDRAVGLLVGQEGVTPAQFAVVVDALGTSGAGVVHHTRVSGALHRACKALDVPVAMHHTLTEVVRESEAVIAAPTTRLSNGSGVWESVRLAKHRKLLVKIVLPDGSISTGGQS